MFVKVRSCSSHKAMWGWLWWLRDKKKKNEEDGELREFSLSLSLSLSWDWENMRVSWEEGVCWVCVWVKAWRGFNHRGRGRYFVFVVIKGTKWIIKGITLDKSCTNSYIKQPYLLLFHSSDNIIAFLSSCLKFKFDNEIKCSCH